MGSFTSQNAAEIHISTLAVLAIFAEAGRKNGKKRRKSGRRPFKRHVAHMAAQPYDPEDLSVLEQPGSEELFEYMKTGEFEDMTAEWYEEALAMGMIAQDERESGEGYSEVGLREHTLAEIDRVISERPQHLEPGAYPKEDLIGPAVITGGLSYCKALHKMKDHHVPQNPTHPKNPNMNTGTKCKKNKKSCPTSIGHAVNPSVNSDYNDMMGHCKDLNKKMNWRKRACTTFLMYVIYNPRYPNLIGPITTKQKRKGKYCKKITKLRNPWRYCTATCPNKPGINVSRCLSRRVTCNDILNEYWNMHTKRDRSEAPCRPLPKQFDSPPPSGHPVNQELRCGPIVCDWIPYSERQWCQA